MKQFGLSARVVLSISSKETRQPNASSCSRRPSCLCSGIPRECSVRWTSTTFTRPCSTPRVATSLSTTPPDGSSSVLLQRARKTPPIGVAFSTWRANAARFLTFPKPTFESKTMTRSRLGCCLLRQMRRCIRRRRTRRPLLLLSKLRLPHRRRRRHPQPRWWWKSRATWFPKTTSTSCRICRRERKLPPNLPFPSSRNPPPSPTPPPPAPSQQRGLLESSTTMVTCSPGSRPRKRRGLVRRCVVVAVAPGMYTR
mmetsp:Transcript_70279/g.165441  ORF Transcript_70279/g.165441 Transcript_70279/m.165441 type:complete len:254 (+) Transcript_70279:718-1479(+)